MSAWAAWAPASQRRILVEHASFVYAFGNTKHSSLFRTGSADKLAKFLLLGFGDIRNVLATATDCARHAAAAVPSRSYSTAASSKQLVPQELQFHLCDWSELNVARGMLLLQLASTVDPSLPDDLDFFWAVLYCLRLAPRHARRLEATVHALVAQPDALRAQLGDAAQAPAVESVLRGWLGGPARGVAEVEEERRRLLMSRVSLKADMEIRTAGQLRQAYQGQAAGVLANLLPWPNSQGWRGGKYQEPLSNLALVDELVEFYMSGSIYRAGFDASSGAGEPSSETTAVTDASDARWVVNPTLLLPGSRQWRLHYGAQPFAGFLPLDPAKHPGISHASGPRALTEACLAELAGLLHGWQACRARCAVSARFWCCDALTLCVTQLAHERADCAVNTAGQGRQEEGALEEQGKAGGGASSAGYDAIDVSNLPDHLGLWNVLALAGPLLRRSPHARLITGHMVWVTGARALGEYVRLACGAEPQLLPTLLGLRLMNDPKYGLERPQSILTRYAQTDQHAVLEWAAEPVCTSVAPLVTAGDGISAALQAWGNLACTRHGIPPNDRSGLLFASPLTLLYAVAGLAGRVRGLLPPGTTTWRQLADALATLCEVPPTNRLELGALCCWALQGAAAGAASAGVQAPASRPTEASRKPVLVTGRLPLSAAYQQAAQRGTTPLLSVHMVSIPRNESMPEMLADLAAVVQGGPVAALRHMHVVDVVGFNVDSQELAFLLPPDHGMIVPDAAVSLLDGAAGRPLSAGPVPLATLRLAPFNVPPPLALTAGLQWLLAEAAGSPAAVPGTARADAGSAWSGGGAELSAGLRLSRLAEFADRYVAELAVERSLGGQLSSKGLQLEFPGASPGGGACQQLKLSLAQPATLRARITFPWPIDSSAASIRVQRSSRTLAATLPKTPVWPSDRIWLPKAEVAELPDWGRGAKELDELGMHMSAMLSHPELEAKSRGAEPGAAGSVMFDVRESLQALFVRTFQGTRAHTLHLASAPHDAEAEVTLFVHSGRPGSRPGAGSGVKRLPDGRPLLHVSYVDHNTARRMYPTEASRHPSFTRFSKIYGSMGRNHGFNRVNCTAEELRVLRAMLARNGAMTQVPSWQAQLLELPSEWAASFLVPAYSDYVADPHKGGALADSLPSLTAAFQRLPSAAPFPSASSSITGPSDSSSSGGNSGSASRRTVSGGGSSSGDGSGGGSGGESAVLRHKEAGNALFKRQQYAAAAEQYRLGIQAAAHWQAQAALAPQEQRRQLLLLNSNLAMALLRQADADPAGAAACLAAAEVACTAALQLEPRNAKVLYRRALARHKQGLARAALADLAALHGSDAGDAAVQSLRVQVEAALEV